MRSHVVIKIDLYVFFSHFLVENLKLTPYHPVMLGADSNTQFPIDCATAHSPIDRAHDGYVYDFVLANRSIVASPLQSVQQFPSHVTAQELRDDCLFAATFGHTITLGCFEHAYFGSEQVVNDLKRHACWSSGYILLDKYTFLRAEAGDNSERRVVGMLFESEDTVVEQSAENMLIVGTAEAVTAI